MFSELHAYSLRTTLTFRCRRDARPSGRRMGWQFLGREDYGGDRECFWEMQHFAWCLTNLNPNPNPDPNANAHALPRQLSRVAQFFVKGCEGDFGFVATDCKVENQMNTTLEATRNNFLLPQHTPSNSTDLGRTVDIKKKVTTQR